MSNEERDETRELKETINQLRKGETLEVNKAINLLRNAAADWGIHRARRDPAAAQREHFKVLEAERALRESLSASQERAEQAERRQKQMLRLLEEVVPLAEKWDAEQFEDDTGINTASKEIREVLRWAGSEGIWPPAHRWLWASREKSKGESSS